MAGHPLLGDPGADSGGEGLDVFLGGVVLFFLVCKKIAFSTFPQQAIFFHLGGGGRRVVL